MSGGFGDRLRLPAATHAQAAERGGVVIYWRPGCPYCALLRTWMVGKTRRATWVNIWEDPEAARFVRGINGGDETVPTVVIDGVAHTNPPPGQVRAAALGSG